MQSLFDMFGAGGHMAPHGYCLLWDPALVWTHVLADALIAAAYFSIPIAIMRFVRRRDDLVFSWIFWLFALFILACGTTHLFAIWTLWRADYEWQAAIKVVTAIASVGTAIVLWPLIPKALALPSPLQLRTANEQLSERVRERDDALSRLQREIAERERVEAALLQAQKMDAVGQLTGGIAHDFNNLLTAVLGGLDMIERSTGEPRTKRLAANGLAAAQRGAKLTGQLLAFSRSQRLDLKPTVIAPLVQGMRELLGQTVGPSVALEFDLDDMGWSVLADPTQLELALLNMAINAPDAMPDGGNLIISTRPKQLAGDLDLADGDYIELCVTDTGQGMSADVVARAFEPFFTTKEMGKGTGLGLSMVYGVARQSGGAARILSQPGDGTSVCILLPRITDEAVPEQHGDDPALAEGPGLRILLIDDDDAVRDVLCETLAELGHEVTSTESAPKGLEAFAADKFDLVVLDFAMPGMNGAEAARAILQAAPGQKILFVTGYSETAALEAAAPGAPVLRKPFQPEEVARALREAAAR
jgi:signal transduction histidine kinase